MEEKAKAPYSDSGQFFNPLQKNLGTYNLPAEDRNNFISVFFMCKFHIIFFIMEVDE